jgi:hypothetical protein
MQSTLSLRNLVIWKLRTASPHDMAEWYSHVRTEHSLPSSTEMQATHSYRGRVR